MKSQVRYTVLALMTIPEPTTDDPSDEQLANYLHQLADAHGISGHTTTPDGTLVYAAYGDSGYDLHTRDDQLTDVDGDLTFPQWLDGRGTLLARRDEQGNEQYDLLEIDPDDDTVTPVLDDQFMNVKARQHPTDPNTVGFVSNRDCSLDLYTVDLDAGTVTKHSTVDEPVMGYAWSPDGDRLVYQAGTLENTSLRIVDRRLNRDDILINEPDSEQSFALTDHGYGAWSEEGIVFTTNHETGYRELAVADPNGEYELRYVNNHDKYDPQWTADDDVVFFESHGGDRRVCRLVDGHATTVERTGMNMDLRCRDDSNYYKHWSTSTAGELRRDGATVVEEGRIDVPTVSPEEISYESFDETEIAARLYEPAGDPVGGIVKAHGGPESQHYSRLDIPTQALVRAGFEVLAPDFRGSIGYGRTFRKATDADLGGDDLTDVVAGATYLRERGHDAVGILGASYGGYMALMAVGSTDAFDMGASVCGVVNWKTTIQDAREYVGEMLMRKLDATPEEKPTLYEERSPISHVEDMDVPLLIVQGGNDPRVPQSEAEQLVTSLESRDVDHEYLLFDDEGHGIVRTENRIEYITQIVEFFSTHV